LRTVAFTPTGWQSYADLLAEDKKAAGRAAKLITDCLRDPFKCIGKPESLRGSLLSGTWSRRITERHRLVYVVTDAHIVVLSCRYHHTRISGRDVAEAKRSK
jgi:toxin YoeB